MIRSRPEEVLIQNNRKCSAPVIPQKRDCLNMRACKERKSLKSLTLTERNPTVADTLLLESLLEPACLSAVCERIC